MSSSGSWSDLPSSVDLSSSLKGLESSFAGAERRLDRIEWEVDQKIKEATKGASVEGGASSSASDLLRSVEAIKAEHRALVKEVGTGQENWDFFIFLYSET